MKKKTREPLFWPYLLRLEFDLVGINNVASLTVTATATIASAVSATVVVAVVVVGAAVAYDQQK